MVGPADRGDGVSVRFTVYGVAAPQGSKVRTRFGGMRESSNRVQPWRDKISQQAGEVMTGLLSGPLHASLVFVFPRRKSDYGTGRNANVLKTSAPVYPTSPPDIDKACRAVLDALTGVCFRDDAQVARLEAVKQYGEPARLEVTLTELEGRRKRARG